MRPIKSRYNVVVPHADANLVDLALATPLNEADVKSEILVVGKINGAIEDPFITMPVQKTGRTSGYTVGEIQQINAVVQVQYDGRIAVFTDQLLAGAMSQPGDSGSAVVSGDKIVGLLFAGSDNTTVINRWKHVESYFNINL
jgi:hypothetical protein